MEDKVQAVYNYIVERCLWQFFSRNWDRERNIKGIMKDVALLYSGKEVSKETSDEKCYYADAKILLEQILDKFTWFEELNSKDVFELTDKVIDKLMYLAVTNSLNVERTVEYY